MNKDYFSSKDMLFIDGVQVYAFYQTRLNGTLNIDVYSMNPLDINTKIRFKPYKKNEIKMFWMESISFCGSEFRNKIIEYKGL